MGDICTYSLSLFRYINNISIISFQSTNPPIFCQHRCKSVLPPRSPTRHRPSFAASTASHTPASVPHWPTTRGQTTTVRVASSAVSMSIRTRRSSNSAAPRPSFARASVSRAPPLSFSRQAPVVASVRRPCASCTHANRSIGRCTLCQVANSIWSHCRVFWPLCSVSCRRLAVASAAI